MSQDSPNDRYSIAAGRFYPADKISLQSDLSTLFNQCISRTADDNVRAIISPHAGYVYSGKTAAAAISSISRDKKYNNIFLIGSSHVMSFEGASVYPEGNYVTPLGKIKVNSEIAAALIDKNPVFRFGTDSHVKEHSLEVQLPLIQYWLEKTPEIVPIIIGTTTLSKIREISDALKPWFTPDNLFIISSDFSHYPTYDDAVKVDNATAKAFITGNSIQFVDEIKKIEKQVDGLATKMCGWTSGLVLLYLTNNEEKYIYEILDYSNSGDSKYGIKDEVVGYYAIRLTENNNPPVVEDSFNLNFSSEEIAQLFKIARSGIKEKLNKDKTPDYKQSDFTANLNGKYGAFVTLKINRVLRGCIGRFISDEPLWKVVSASAISSAFEDPRFLPLSKDEFPRLEFEITVLGPLRKISSISEIIIGKHGLYLRKDNHTGTLLPQVATENGWSVEEFLGYTARDKAGIGWEGWKSAEIFVYDGLVLGDPNR